MSNKVSAIIFYVFYALLSIVLFLTYKPFQQNLLLGLWFIVTSATLARLIFEKFIKKSNNQ